LPTSFSNDIILLANGDAPTFSLVNVVPTTMDLVLPYEVAKGSAAATDEGSAYHNSDGADDPELGTKRIGARKLTRSVSLTEEAFADIPALQGYCTQNLGSQIGEGMEAWLVNGNGTTQPEGVLTGAANGIETAASDVIGYDDIIKLMAAPKSAYLAGAKFLMNRQTMAYLAGLKNANGVPVFPGLFEFRKLFGFDVAVSDAMPVIADNAKAVLFGNFKRYATCGVRGGLTVKIADQEDAKLGKINFYGSRRLDQKVLVPEAVQYLKIKA
jgi:HK97 family phage major capsid protein